MYKKHLKKISLAFIVSALLISWTSYKDNFFEIAKQIEIFTTLYKEINMNYVDEVNPAELMDTAIKEMLTDLDPYTVFMNEQDVEDAKIRNSGEYSGVGALIKNKGGKLIVIEPFKDYPADLAGLKAGDEIVKIGDVLVSEAEDDPGALLKGSPGSKIELTFLRNGQTMNTQLVRKDIEVDAVPYYKMASPTVGYIVLTEFNQKASDQVADAIRDLKLDGATSIILDLRGNPGGLLNEAVEVVNLFVPRDQLVVSTQSKVQKYNNIYLTKNNPLDLEMPLAILINGRSASASEIVSGALQDLDRAVVIGSKSFGKGLVQRPKPLLYGTQVKITISRYFIPSGRGIQALDYKNRDAQGNATRLDDKNIRAFRTKNGRTVFDHGGITPDIFLQNQKIGNVTKALSNEDLIFNFATQFYYANPHLDWNNFSVTDKHLDDFQTYVQKENFEFVTQTEQVLDKAIETAIGDELKNALQTDLAVLKTKISQEKENLIRAAREEIRTQLTQEIVKRYAYREGLYSYNLKTDDAILKAKEILDNPATYNAILQPK
ncbi:MAG: S41 family peptidase [Flavobacteriaceae bacterium]|nr:S41 family peptidase [Flavobacteriaceae bacterium]